MRLVGQSWRYLRREPRLFVLPAISSLATAIAALAIFAPALYLTRDARMEISLLVATAVSAGPFIFISTFFNVGFLAMVIAHQRGERATVRDGLRAARARLPQILAWTLLAAIVGVVLDALARLPGGDLGERILSGLAGLAWSLATFFAVPIIALEGTGAIESVRRSARVFRERWGEAVIGDIAIGVVFTVLLIPGFGIGMLGVDLLENGASALALGLIAAGVVLVVPLLILSSALAELFTLELYRLSAGCAVAGPFTEEQLRAAIEPRKRRWWRR